MVCSQAAASDFILYTLYFVVSSQAAASDFIPYTLYFLVCSQAAASDLAVAFQLSGCTAGVMVCFVLPGMLQFGTERREREAGLAGSGWPGTPRWAWAPQTCGEAAGLAMVAVGIASGVIAMGVLVWY